MADNVTLNKSSGTFDAASDDVGGVQFQKVKLDIGGDGVSSPVTDLATSAKQDTGNTSLSSIDTKITAVNTGAVVVSSSALPSGAATSANQTTVIGHLDGVEGLLTTIDADTGNLPTIETNTDFGTVVGGGTETGALRVTVANNSTGVLSVDDNGGSLTVDGTVAATQSGTWTLGANSGVDVGDVTINNAAGASAVNIQDGGNSITVDGTVAVSGTVTVDSELPTAAALSDTTANPTAPMVGAAKMLWDGTQWVRERNNLGDGSGGGQIGQMGNMVYNGSTWDRVRGDTTGMDNHLVPKTTGGLTIFRSIDLDETEEEAKATAGQVYGWYIYNTASSVRYVKLYNATAANVTVGTTTPVMTIPIPATSGANVEFTNGIAFSTAITAAATTGVADSDTGAPGANEVIINLLYK
jgi:hypothetical protein